MTLRYVFLLLICLVAGACAQAAEGRGTVTIFAAASLKTVLDDIAPKLPGNIVLAYGGSAAMARQIVQGAEADILITAHPEWMEWAITQGALRRGSSCALISNTLVLAAAKGAPELKAASAKDILDALDGGRLAVGQLRAVPAGQYAQEWMSSHGWLDALMPHLVQTQNVRHALALIARGDVPMGVVYRSDVQAEPRVSTVYDIPASSHRRIVYPAALTAHASAAAEQVLSALARHGDIFAAQGFLPLAPGTVGACR